MQMDQHAVSLKSMETNVNDLQESVSVLQKALKDGGRQVGAVQNDVKLLQRGMKYVANELRKCAERQTSIEGRISRKEEHMLKASLNEKGRRDLDKLQRRGPSLERQLVLRDLGGGYLDTQST